MVLPSSSTYFFCSRHLARVAQRFAADVSLPPHYHQTNGERLPRVGSKFEYVSYYGFFSASFSRRPEFISQAWGIYGGDNSNEVMAGFVPTPSVSFRCDFLRSLADEASTVVETLAKTVVRSRKPWRSLLLRLLLLVIFSSLRMHLEVAAGKDFVSSVSSSHSRDPQLAGVSCRPRPLTRRTGYFPLFDRDL